MLLLEALQASYAEGMGCRVVGEDDGVVRWLTRCGQSHKIRTGSPATRAKRGQWVEDGGPVVLAEWLKEHELCPLPPGQEPDFRPVHSGAPMRISDLLG